MNDDKEVLKARIAEREQDLLHYLRYRHELSSRSKAMAAVVEKEIESLEKEIEELYKLL